MATTSPRTIPASKHRFAVALAGVINGVNVVFTTPEKFRHDPPRAQLALYYNGQRLFILDDFTVTESGGPGTGYDTVSTLFAPRPGDKLWADYFAV